MAIESHLAELVERHRVLERSIEEEMARPYADDFKVAQLKKRKLRLKEEIVRLKGQVEPVH
jgi:hypothetical protein